MQEVIDTEVKLMLAEVQELAQHPIERYTVEELNALRVDEVEPMVTRATDYLKARSQLTVDGQQRPEMRALADKIGIIKERVRYLEVRAMLDEVATATAVPIVPFGMDELFDHRTSRLKLLLERAMALPAGTRSQVQMIPQKLEGLVLLLERKR